jgi:glutamyl-tRNA reductase
MHSQLVLIHRPKEAGAFNGLGPNWLVWQTCVRQLAIGFGPDFDVPAGLKDHKMCGAEAYQFLLEVVCGLHSPVKGETEVHGQFRQFVEQVEKTEKKHPHLDVLKKINLDARQIRANHLQRLGSQSYGSLARKKLRGLNEAHIVGAGHLTREILPWLAKMPIDIFVYTRSVDKNQDLMSLYSQLQVSDYSSAPNASGASGLILSAPVSSGFLADWAQNRLENFSITLDYRAESKFDPLRLPNTYLHLEDIFREITDNKVRVEEEVEKAKKLIKTLCA